mgnify:CR=1 FL=1
MKRHSALVRLSKDHHQGLLLAQVLLMNDKAYKGYPTDTKGKADYTIAFFNSELIQHFKIEEEILFQLVKNLDTELNRLIEEITSEHKKLYELIENIKINNESAELLKEFGKLLESHIRKEERILFEMIQELADDSLMRVIKEKIENYSKT